jgi:transposase-like protein
MMGMWFIFLDPYLIMMVLLRNQNTNDEEEVGSGLYNGEEEEMEEDDEIYSDGANKPKESSMPLWKYVARNEGGKVGENTKFTCPHCNTTYTSSYTHARKHLYGIMLSDKKKSI